MASKESIRPKYQVIADDLRAKIEAGTYGPRDQLPIKAALGELYSAAPGTIERALEVLRDEGLTETIHGRGTFVRDQEPPTDESEDLAERVARLEAQMMDVYANLGMAPSSAQEQNRRIG